MAEFGTKGHGETSELEVDADTNMEKISDTASEASTQKPFDMQDLQSILDEIEKEDEDSLADYIAAIQIHPQALGA